VIGAWFAVAGVLCGLLLPRQWWVGALAGIVGVLLAPGLAAVDRPLAAGYEVFRTLGPAALGALIGSRLRG
jgi:hypothetical protein